MTKRITITRHGVPWSTYVSPPYDVEVEDLDAYVLVKFMSGGRGVGASYCYRDPLDTLEIGDIVEVPVATSGTSLAQVVDFGKGGFTGIVKDVIAKLERTPL